MRTVLVLMDTLRRDVLSCYNPATDVQTPNLDAFAERSCVFDNHWIGSAPCMPARRDILTGRYNFLERPWGPSSPSTVTLPACLRANGNFCHITTDHCHYLRTGGEGYLQEFNTWDYYRGQEGDPWVSRIDEPNNMPETFYGRVREQYQKNRQLWPNEEDMPSPKTFQSACDWIDGNAGADDFFLMVEAFDPHEPFDVPDKYMEMYGGTGELDRDYFEIPEYKRVSATDVNKGAEYYLQRRYKALVTMTDRSGLVGSSTSSRSAGCWTIPWSWSPPTTAISWASDDYMGKNYMHLYNELAHLPFIVHFPGNARAGEHARQLTQAIDIMPTVLEAHGCEIPADVCGTSLVPLMTDADAPTRGYALYGVHAMTVNVTDGRYTYFRAPVAGNQPCFEYTALPHTIRKKMGSDCPEEIECGRYFKRTKYPLFKIPCKKPAQIEGATPLAEVEQTMLFDLESDYGQVNNLAGKDDHAEQRMIDLLLRGLEEHESPAEQKERLGLA